MELPRFHPLRLVGLAVRVALLVTVSLMFSLSQPVEAQDADLGDIGLAEGALYWTNLSIGMDLDRVQQRAGRLVRTSEVDSPCPSVSSEIVHFDAWSRLTLSPDRRLVAIEIALSSIDEKALPQLSRALGPLVPITEKAQQRQARWIDLDRVSLFRLEREPGLALAIRSGRGLALVALSCEGAG